MTKLGWPFIWRSGVLVILSTVIVWSAVTICFDNRDVQSIAGMILGLIGGAISFHVALEWTERRAR